MLAAKIYPNGEFWVGGVAASSKGLVDVDKNHKSPRGSKGLTSGNKRLIRNAVHLLGDAYDPKNLTLFTGTLPGETQEDCRLALSIWPNLTRRFLQEVKRDLLRVGFPLWFVGCTEIQPKRMERTGQPWPHIHIVIPTGMAGQWVITGKRLKGLWSKIAASELKRDVADFDLSARVDRVTGKKKLSRYLSKYMSKAGDQDVLDVLNDEDYPRVHSWKHCSAELTAAVDACTSKLSSQVALKLYHLAKKRADGCEVWAEICDTSAADDWAVNPLGYVGTLSEDLIGWLLAADDRIRISWEAG
jgi:hypothetical protein